MMLAIFTCVKSSIDSFIHMVYLLFSLLYWLQINVHWRRSLLCTAVFDSSIADWIDFYFERCRLILPNIMEQWEFSTAETLFLN